MKDLVESPFLDLLDAAQKKKIESVMIEELSKKFEAYGYKLVPLKEETARREVTISHHKPKGKKKTRDGVAYRGKSYRSLKKACEELGLSYVSVGYYKRKGEEIEAIFDRLLGEDTSSKPKFVKRKRGELVSLQS